MQLLGRTVNQQLCVASCCGTACAQHPPALMLVRCRQVRSEAAAVHAQITAAAGRGLARSLKQLSGSWWAAQHDEHAEAARSSAGAFQACFPGPKAKEALLFCHSQVSMK